MTEDKGYNARELWQQVNPEPVLSYDFRSCVCIPSADERKTASKQQVCEECEACEACEACGAFEACETAA